jgi:type IV pilus assembly protein PilA
MPSCPRCAASVQDGVSFCPTCGHNLRGAAAAPAGKTPVSPAITVTYTGPQTTSGKAIGSLVCGLFFFLLPLTLVGIILGHLSLSDIKKSAGRLQGRGLALGGLVLSYMGIVFVPFILILAAIAIPNLLRARMGAQEASAVNTLRTYNAAMGNYATQCQNFGFPQSVENLGPGNGDCQGAGLVDSVLAAPAVSKSGYRFFYTPGPADNLGHVVSYTITADPITENATGIRHFFTDESAVIRTSRGAPATADSPSIR